MLLPPPRVPCLPQSAHSRALSPVHALRASRGPPTCLPPPGARSLSRTVCPACDPRQDARAFNQLLSWDTSRVLDMSNMFAVRCSPHPARPNRRSRPLRALPPVCTVYTPAGEAARAPLILYPVHALRPTLGRAKTPCPTPTSCSSAARGRAPPNSGMARAGGQETAPEGRSARVLLA